MEEDDAEVGALVLRLGDEAAVHVRVPARLVDEQPPHAVEPLGRQAALLEDRPALELRHAARDDPERLAGRVVVDRRELRERAQIAGATSAAQNAQRRASSRNLAEALGAVA